MVWKNLLTAVAFTSDHCCCHADAKTFHTVLKLDRGCSWETALDYRDKYVEEMRAAGRPPSAKSGFYFDTKKHGEQGKLPAGPPSTPCTLPDCQFCLDRGNIDMFDAPDRAQVQHCACVLLFPGLQAPHEGIGDLGSSTLGRPKY